jgi:protein gp37
MADSTSIEWTDATWNPVTGCTKISAGCDHCYAERFSERFRGTRGHPFETGFDLTLRPERLDQPLRWRLPRMIFVNSMSDLFHKEIPKDFIARVFDTMEAAPWHTFQVLTKRSSLMRDFLRKRYGTRRSPSHMWFGVSIEDGTKTSRVRHLREAPAGVRFLSIEPLIGAVEILDLTEIDWVIVGGESGPGARPMKQEWFFTFVTDASKRACRFSLSNGADARLRRAGGSLRARSGASFRCAVGSQIQNFRRPCEHVRRFSIR